MFKSHVITRSLIVLACGLALGACQKKPVFTPYDHVEASQADCSKNVFLQRYGCSLDRVETAAESNDSDAEYALGYMYFYGIGTVKDKETAIVWIKRAAEQGQPLAITAMQSIRRTQYPKMGQAHLPKTSKNAYQEAIAPKNIPPSINPHQVAHSKVTSTPPVVVAKKPSLHHLKALNHHYTLQLMASHDLAIVKGFIKAHQLGKQAGFYQTRFQGNPWYVLIYGDYQSSNAAHNALGHLPASVKAMHPWVKPYQIVQKELLSTQAG